MSGFTLLALAVVCVIVAQVVIRMLVPKAPTQKTYVCARCGSNNTHGERTVFAWTRGERQFYCDPCNVAWLESCTPAQRRKYDRNMAQLARSKRKNSV